MNESEIIRVYGETIFERGLGYFRTGRVTNVIKFRGRLIGEVSGTVEYVTEVDLDSLRCDCSCPYGGNCKHGVAVLLQYSDGGYVDCDEIMERVEAMDRDELIEVVEEFVRLNPASLMYLHAPPAKDEGVPDEAQIKALDKRIRSMLRGIVDYGYADREFADDLSGLIRFNEALLTKEQIFYIIEFLANNSDEYGYFYDDYAEDYFGEEIFENLCDAFVRKELEASDFERLKALWGMDGCDMIGPFFHRMTEVDNAEVLVEFKEHIREFLNAQTYVEFLINCGLVDCARELIEEGESLFDGNRFRSYLRIDKKAAIEFARREGFYSSLIQYYHETGEHDETVDLFLEVIRDHSLKDRLDRSSYFYRNVLDSIKKSGSLDKSGTEDALRDLFEICYSTECYDVCVDSGIELGDKELLRRLIGKEITHNFGVRSKMELLSYLLDEYPDEVAEELKSLASSLIEAMGNYSYKKAADCVFWLKEIVPNAEWREYVKEVYDQHFRKINLWKEFKRRGVVLKRRKGVVEMVG
ncbi:MAG: SWIM zinc finger family protein [Euryarchaeota archaeon]|nr:SWIM zinc finger family protein [Euryarchaeota archaeon]